MNGRRRRVLVAGATGYIGRRLVAELVAGGHEVRCLARTPDKLDAETWRSQVEVVAGDVLVPASLASAFRNVDVAYYLVHMQRALFRPRGLFGRTYWYAVAPFHRFIFGPLARNIEQRAVRAAESLETTA